MRYIDKNEHKLLFQLVHRSAVRVERPLLREPLKADGALIGPLPAVHPQVDFQIVLHRELLPAVLALERTLSGMGPQVVVQAVLLFEPAVTVRADKGLFSSVSPEMFLEIRFPRKPFPAKPTGLRVRVAAVLNQCRASSVTRKYLRRPAYGTLQAFSR